MSPHAEIAAALADYFDGWYEADADRLARVLHPSCHLFCVIDGALDDDDREKVLESVRRRESPASRGEVRRDRIVAIDVSSPVTALAKVELAIGRKLFTDYLSLLRLDGSWQVISKTFSWALLPPGEAAAPAGALAAGGARP